MKTILSAALALSGLGRKVKEAVPALGELLKDDNARTRQHAITALAAIGPHAKAVLPAGRRRDTPRHERGY